MQTKKILIGGEWRRAAEKFEVNNPYSNQKIADVYSVNDKENAEAITAAAAAANQMRKLQRFEIAKGLRKIAAALEKRKSEFAETIARESAKPINNSIGEVLRGIATFEWAAGEAERFTGDIVSIDTIEIGAGKSAYTNHLPRGVIYGITPFNFPLNLVAHKVAPALAAANSIIIKPSPRTPLTSLLLGEVFLECGLPTSALQIVPMDTKYIDSVYHDERVKMISFTGSAEVGWDIKSRANKKMVTLELGGSAPVIVDRSADIQRSLEQTVKGAFVYAGQVCIAVQRVYIHEKIFDEWTDKFISKAKSLKKGDPLDSGTELSVMITEDAAKKAASLINEAKDYGAEILCGGAREGSMLDATVVTKTTPEMRIVSEEIFAPVATVEKFAEFEEAVELANLTKYGLQAGVFTNDLKNVQFASNNLEFGGVIINDAPTFRVDNMPYGGVKDSGFGREGIRYAMEEMSQIRLIVLNS